MVKKVEHVTSVDLASLVNSHSKPFVVIDKDYRILAVNDAYESRYGTSREDSVGKTCYQVSHGKKQPCSLEGEDCPHQQLFKGGKPKTCIHVHCDSDHRMHQVKVSAVPLYGVNNEFMMGESIEDIFPQGNHYKSGEERMVGISPTFLACIDQLGIAANSDAPVLLQGETGTGKELAAEYIHLHSARKNEPFQIIDSTTFSENLFESEMFGHASGAYTGSAGEKPGLFELADGGTIFLDEIGDMPATQQAKLLRVLENGEYRRVGGKQIRKVNVRIICATNRHLWESVSDGSFREDLYYRIACLNIRLPGLRERLDDIPVLAQSLLEGISRSADRNYFFAQDAMERLKAYEYPGNIRELRNIVFIAATRSYENKIDAALIDSVFDNLPSCAGSHASKNNGVQHTGSPAALSASTAMGLAESENKQVTLREIEAKYISELLAQNRGNRKKVANVLGISERTMYRKIKDLGIT